MILYPSIPQPRQRLVDRNLPCIAFEKYDGSNLRWEWSRKQGWHKFGTRTRMFDHTDEIYGSAIPLFMETLAEPIEKILKDNKRNLNRAVVFTEFFGPNSFAGTHIPHDPKTLKLFDVWVGDHTLVGPEKFVEWFDGCDFSAKVIYRGPYNKEFVDTIKHEDLGLDEGVVAKGVGGVPGNRWLSKIKTLKYLEKLKTFRPEDWQNLWNS